MGTLDDRVILVTGGSRGIGAAVARAVAGAGADVALGYLTDADRVAAVGREIEALGCAAFTYRADVSRRSEVDALVAATLARYGRIDGLVNNAGVMPESPFLDIDDDEWEQVMRTDLFGAFYTCQAVLPQMLERGSGSIVNVASRLGQIGFAGVAHYATAKAGLIGLTKTTARELASRSITCNAIAPGLIETDLIADLPEQASEAIRAMAPLGYIGSAADVAGAAVYFASDEARYVTGQVLGVDGGIVMGS